MNETIIRWNTPQEFCDQLASLFNLMGGSQPVNAPAAMTPPPGAPVYAAPQQTPAAAPNGYAMQNTAPPQAAAVANGYAAPVQNAAPPQSIPVQAAPTTPPVAPPPSYTIEQISKAGADLVAQNPAKMPELMNLLAQFGVQAVTLLKPEQLGDFATALRGLGANL